MPVSDEGRTMLASITQLTQVAPLAQDSAQGGNFLTLALPLLLMGGVFYFLLIRPQQRRMRAQQALLNSVEVGDDVVTTSGIFGRVTDIDEDEGSVTVEIATGTQVRMLKQGIARRLTGESYEDEPEPGDDQSS
jgi:preprotein translocase subunit YajC